MLRRIFLNHGELTLRGRTLAKGALGIYLVLLCLMCFLPQSIYPNPKQVSTPGIVQYGRLYFLLTPFNTFVNSQEIKSFYDLIWIVLQNISNIFLLYPLLLVMLFLFPRIGSWKKVLKYSFLISLSIEVTQLILDAVIDAGRVFEIDDLMTNSLGGLLAYWTFLLWKKYHRHEKRVGQKSVTRRV